MKGYDLLDAVGGIDSKYIEAADADAPRKSTERRIRWIGWAAAAACVCIAVGLLAPRIGGVIRGGGDSGMPAGGASENYLEDVAPGGAAGAQDDAGRSSDEGVLTAGPEDAALPEEENAARADSADTAGGGSAEQAAVQSAADVIADMRVLYQSYGIESAEDIASIAAVDPERNEVIGEPVTGRAEIAEFYGLSTEWTADDDEAQISERSGAVPADDLTVIRIETNDGQSLFMEVCSADGWIRERETSARWRIDDSSAAWIEQNLQ